MLRITHITRVSIDGLTFQYLNAPAGPVRVTISSLFSSFAALPTGDNLLEKTNCVAIAI